MPAPRISNAGSAYAWLVVFVLMLLYTCSFIDRTIINLLVKPIRADLGISDSEFSYLTGFAFVILYSTMAIPYGWAVDRLSRRGLIAGGVFIWSAMTALCGVAGSYGQLFAARVGVSVGEASLSPATYSLISDYFPAHRLSRALSVFALGVPLGTGLANVIGGPLVQAMVAAGPRDLPIVGTTRPWQEVFVIVGPPGLLLGLLTLLVVGEPRRTKPKPADQPSFTGAVSYVWRERAVYLPIFVGMGCFCLFAYGSNAWYPSFLTRVWGMSIAEAGLFLGLSTLVLGIAGTLASGFLSDWLVARGRHDGHLLVGYLYVGGMLICGVGGPLVPVEWLSLVLISGTAFFSFTWVGSCAALVQLVTPARMRGQVSAIYLFFLNFISLGGGPTAVAWATDHLFHRDDAVGLSLALVASVSLSAAMALLLAGRHSLVRLLGRTPRA